MIYFKSRRTKLLKRDDKYFGASPSGKAVDSDSTISRVQILPPQPYLWNKKDVHPLKPVPTGFFGVLRAKISRSKPWMLFRAFYNQMGFEPSTKQIKEKFKADLRRIILNLPFLYNKIVYKVCKTVLSGITKNRGTKQSGLFCFLKTCK